MKNRLFPVALSLCFALGACSKKSDTGSILDQVPVTSVTSLPCVKGEVHVIYTEANQPHVYGESERDVACAQGFITARDRYFEMEMASRLALGRLSELFGELGLATDIENRTSKMTAVADRILETTSDEWRARMDAYVAGVNEYVRRVGIDAEPPPPEFELLKLIAGKKEAKDMMSEWEPRKIVGMGTIVVFEAGYGTGDLALTKAMKELESWGTGLPNEALRKDGALKDIATHVKALHAVASDPDFKPATSAPLSAAPRVPAIESSTLQRAINKGDSRMRRSGRLGGGIGSNAWAISPALTADGSTMLAGDGHLSLTVPTFFYLAHLDTSLLGGGDLHSIGLSLPGVPIMGPGTNGYVAWTQTVLYGDTIDWYAEEVRVDTNGKPKATLFQGKEKPIVAVTESYGLTDGSTLEIDRYETEDGRVLYSLEGEVVSGPEKSAKAVNVNGEWIVARDMDSDGIISGVTMTYLTHDERGLIDQLGRLTYAKSVEEAAELLQGVVNYSAVLTMADVDGNVMTNGYVSYPCRNYLPKDGQGRPVVGADPTMLIDGTRYPSWKLQFTEEGKVDRSATGAGCVVSPENYPIGHNESQGYVLNANNDIYGNTFDDDLWNEPYFGGPYALGFRAARIAERIEAEAGKHTVETLEALQADHRSNTADMFLGDFLAAIERASAVTDGVTGSALRVRTLYQTNKTRVADAAARLSAWQAAGLSADSGVETFYNSPDAAEKKNAVATSIWNAWLIHTIQGTFDDEGLPSGVFRGGYDSGRVRMLRRLLDGTASNLASWHPATGGSVFWDDAGTGVVETRDETLLAALVGGLDWLASEPGEDMRSGGFGSDDPEAWLWGLKHFLRLESILAEAVDASDLFADFGIGTDTLPLTESKTGDVRDRLKGFPRPGDLYNVDAAHYRIGEDLSYTKGPVMRMVISMSKEGVKGVNILPGGQSGHNDSEFFADQAAMWLGNEALPLRFTPKEVVDGAQGHEVLKPR